MVHKSGTLGIATDEMAMNKDGLMYSCSVQHIL